MLRDLLLVIRMFPAEKQPAMDFGMKRFHAPAEHFRPAGEIGNVAHRYSVFAQELRGSAGREDFDFHGGEPLRKVHDSSFVKNADQRPLHRHESLRKEKNTSV